MPFAYPEPWALKGAILGRVRAGETLRAIGAEAGMPTEGTVLAWARADAAFRADLTVAMRQGAWRRVYAFDEGKAAAMLAAMRDGAGVHDVVGTPGMPSWTTYRHWRRTEPGFLEPLWWLRQGRRQTWSVRWSGRRRDYTPALADKVLAKLWMGVRVDGLHAADPALPGVKTLRRWRREQPEFDRLVRGLTAAWRVKRPKWNVARRCTPELTQAICDAILVGGTFRSVGDTPGMPDRGTLGRWMKTQAAFAREVGQACVDREDWFHDHIDIVEREMAPGMSLAQLKAIRRRAAPWRAQLGRLKNRPGMAPGRGVNRT